MNRQNDLFRLQKTLVLLLKFNLNKNSLIIYHIVKPTYFLLYYNKFDIEYVSIISDLTTNFR
jgi:hypothetical protein